MLQKKIRMFILCKRIEWDVTTSSEVLCYNLGSWDFERSRRLCMQFKITCNKSARRNRILPSF